MNWEKNFGSHLAKFLRPEQFVFNEPMIEHTTFKIGGKADVLVYPSSVEEVIKIFELVKIFNLPCEIIGNGSNILVLDKGIRGVVVNFTKKFFGNIICEDQRIIANTGANLRDVSMIAAENGLTGLEFAIGIPGSIGGAIFMNASAYDGAMANVVVRVKSITRDGEIVEFNGESINFSYRHSIFQENGQAICEVEMILQHGDVDAIKRKMDDFTERRESKQPLEFPSVGSIFKRPKNNFAGTLIDKTGLKGLRIGGAVVSKKHAGFILNDNHATSSDVLKLLNEVRQRVYDTHKVMLAPEVRLIGVNP